MRTFLRYACLILSLCLADFGSGAIVSTAAAALPSPTPTVPKSALVVAMSDYHSLPPLPQCRIAGRNVAAALRDVGFEVSETNDIGNAALNATLSGFAQKAPPQSVLIVYYCGYTAAFNGRSFLVPVSAELATADRIMVEGVAATAVANVLANADARAAIAALDLAPAPDKSEPISEAMLSPVNSPPEVTTLALSQSVPGGLGNGLAGRLRKPSVNLRTLVEQTQEDWKWQLGITLALTNLPPADIHLRGDQQDKTPSAAATPAEAGADVEGQMSLPERQRVQSRLRALGLYDGPIDGIFGDQTRAAIRRYQQANGLPPTGYLDVTGASRLLFFKATGASN